MQPMRRNMAINMKRFESKSCASRLTRARLDDLVAVREHRDFNAPPHAELRETHAAATATS